MKRFFQTLHLKRWLGGVRAFLTGWKIIRRQRLLRFLFLPGILSLITGSALFFLLLFYFSDLLGKALLRYDLAYLYILSYVLAFFLSSFVFIFTFRILAALWIVPFLGPLQARLEIVYSNHSLETGWKQEISIMLRGLWASLWQAFLSLLLLLLTLFLGPLQVLVILPVEAYFSARSLIMLYLDKLVDSSSNRRLFLRMHRPELIGLGMAYLCCLFIPALGVILAPSIGLAGAGDLFFSSSQNPAGKSNLI